MIRVGTSGYNYPEWKGKFYPEKFSSARMLPYYAERFGTVEINASFYRMPTPKVLAGWAAQVPESFVFALKAPKRITHERRLKECEPDVQFFVESAATLGHRLGPLLFQLPPNLKCDLARFDTFLGWLPRDLRIAFEFRNDSWFDPEVYARLRDRNLALCLADSAERHPPLEATAAFGYLRLRDEGYDEPGLVTWADRARTLGPWDETYVYFKHEDEGRGPEFARRFIELLA
ncbi:MAG: DUF72 domain-containing protein [Acidobacteria bacterium]|jgi:uncharacterized protein YecE (DUF72 family)|nr:DUF72 domain-containing protein [Acidobacteriota bacterium]